MTGELVFEVVRVILRPDGASAVLIRHAKTGRLQLVESPCRS